MWLERRILGLICDILGWEHYVFIVPDSHTLCKNVVLICSSLNSCNPSVNLLHVSNILFHDECWMYIISSYCVAVRLYKTYLTWLTSNNRFAILYIVISCSGNSVLDMVSMYVYWFHLFWDEINDKKNCDDLIQGFCVLKGFIDV